MARVGSLSRGVVARVARVLLPGGLAATGLLLAVLSTGPAGYVAACGALVVGWWAHRPAPLGADVATRVLVAATVLIHAGEGATGAWWPLLASGAVALGLVLAEPVLQRAGRPWYRVANLGVPVRWPVAAVTGSAVWLADSALLVWIGLVGVAGQPAAATLPPVVAVALLWALVGGDAARRYRSRHRDELAALRDAVTAHGPRFLLYFSAPPGSGYQARMWLPFLEQIGEPFLVVMPDAGHLTEFARLTDAPVIAYESFEAFDALLVPGLRTAFYVNNGMHNVHCVRYRRLTHVQLYHGDSDKAVTASPVNALYDLIFVAGQAAIDRYALHGVRIPTEKFRVVGRPQVAQVRPAARPIHETPAPVVLYAPTWVGGYADTRHCSLPIGEAVVRGLLERGATVIVRPHPYIRRDRRSAATLRRIARLLAEDRRRTGRPHRVGGGQPLAADINASDAMVCDVSAVASDYLASGKPFAITDMAGAGAAMTESFPLARAAYVLRRDAGNLTEVLADLLGADPLAEVRRNLRAYYLGDAPPERHPEMFLAEARAVVAEPAAARSVG